MVLDRAFRERERVGDLLVARLLVSPAPRAALLLGKLLPCLVVNLVQVAVLFGVGAFVMPAVGAPRLELGAHPLTLIPISIAASLSATGLGLLLAALARTIEQLGGLGTMVVVTMAALGAYQDVLIRGQGLAQVMPAIAMLLGFAVLFFGSR